MTPHIEAKKGEIAKTVIMPGDPKRASMIAEKYLEEAKLVSNIRGMCAYTGKYNGKEVTVMASGMGMPSIGIYSYELYNFYDVENIIRVGSCGAYSEELNIYDVVLVTDAFSTSSFAKVQNGSDESIIGADESLNKMIENIANENNIAIHKGRIYSSDVFYTKESVFEMMRDKYNCLGVEMESFALFHNAKVLGKHAACVLTVSDSFVTHEVTTPIERQNSFTKMIELVLKSIV